MTKNKLAASVRKHIRGEKLRLRMAGIAGEDFKQRIAELYKKMEKKSGVVGSEKKRVKTTKVKKKKNHVRKS
ncbi:MAG: hypothetical protein AAB378_01745 [Patescibacteria group bacterium]